MKVLDFETSLENIEIGKLELADTTKSSLWQHAPHWFDVLDFEDDSIFLEPTLFYYFKTLFRQETCLMPLEQILYGYAPKGSVSPTIKVYTDSDGVIYLPNLGYVFTNTEGIKEYTITFCDDNKNIILDGVLISIEALKFIKNDQFKLIGHKSGAYLSHVIFEEGFKKSISSAQGKLMSVLNMMENNMLDFYSAIAMTTREFAIFNSNNFESFAALHHFGTAFLNLAGQNQREVFFLDDIAHQSGHTIYYTLTHDFQKFLKPNRETSLQDFTNIPNEQRGVYGAFHGLFTYTTILHSLNLALQNKWFKGDEQEEALARLGFYYGKFQNDLRNMGDSRILTEEGWRYYDMFHSGFNKIKKEYYHIVKYFDYSSQNYNFNFENFKKANQFQTV